MSNGCHHPKPDKNTEPKKGPLGQKQPTDHVTDGSKKGEKPNSQKG